MNVRAGVLQVDRATKRSHEEEEGIHVSLASAWPLPKGRCHTVTLKQTVEYLSTRDSSGRVKERLKYCKKLMPKIAVQASKKIQLPPCGTPAKMTHHQSKGPLLVLI